MVKRHRIGIIYSNNENWIGGSYYILNLVCALNYIEDPQKPVLIVFAKTAEEFKQVENTKYPYLQWSNYNDKLHNVILYKRIINRIQYVFSGKNLYNQYIVLPCQLDFIFPSPIELKAKNKVKKIFWIPDFQEQRLPSFFSKAEIKRRVESHYLISLKNEIVVFSSQDAFNDFSKLFPNSKIQKFILNFAVTHPAYNDLRIEELKEKYNINSPYFFAPNQFWKHKNQIVILKAIKILKEKGIMNFMVVFTGKEYDYRNLNYFDSLMKYVEENHLHHYVRFLGFIDRKEQLKLMDSSIAVIQPSFFEGWSTVVEDAKAMNQYVIVSDISVHREQLDRNVTFFDPENAIGLSDIMLDGIKCGYQKEYFNYNQKVYKFGLDFMNIIKGSLPV